MHWKKFNDIVNRTRDLSACSIVPQPTILPRRPYQKRYQSSLYLLKHSILIFFFLPLGVESCCASIQLVPYNAVDRNKVSRRQLIFIFLLSHYVFRPLRAHLQVRYIIGCYNGLFLIQRIRCTYGEFAVFAILCLQLLYLYLCDNMYWECKVGAPMCSM
jgi:hypothetical protein